MGNDQPIPVRVWPTPYMMERDAPFQDRTHNRHKCQYLPAARAWLWPARFDGSTGSSYPAGYQCTTWAACFHHAWPTFVYLPPAEWPEYECVRRAKDRASASGLSDMASLGRTSARCRIRAHPRRMDNTSTTTIGALPFCQTVNYQLRVQEKRS